MANKVSDFGNAVSLRQYLNDLIDPETTGYEPKRLVCLNRPSGSNTTFYNVQIVWTGDNFYVCGNANSDSGSFYMIPFNEHEWTIGGGEPKTYTLTFALDGGSLTEGNGFDTGTSNQTKTVTFDSTYNADDGTGKTWPKDPVKTGHTFLGWKNGNTLFTADGKVSITENTTITAQWTQIANS